MNNNYQTAEEQYQQILEEVAMEFDVDLNLLSEMINYERDKVHLKKRRGAKDELRKMIEQWIEKQSS